MAQTMIASNEAMTDGQIEEVVNKFRSALRKKRDNFPSDAVQRALGAKNMGMRMIAPFQELVEMHCDSMVDAFKAAASKDPHLRKRISEVKLVQDDGNSRPHSEIEGEMILATLAYHQGDMLRASQALGVTPEVLNARTFETEVPFGNSKINLATYLLILRLEADPG